MLLGGGPVSRPHPVRFRPHVPRAAQKAPGLRTAAKPPRPKRGPKPAPVYANPFRGIRGLVPQRIDQGVDYSAPAGSQIHAIGPGRIIAASTSSGWPGGGFIAEQLTAGPAKGHVWFTAEDVTPSVRAGQTVTPGTVIGKFAPGGSIETGWGTEGALAGNAIASGPAYGYPTEAARSGDPGALATGWGQAASRLLHSLGAPAGILSQPASGGAPGWASAPGGKYFPGKTTGLPAPVMVPVSFTSPVPSSGTGGGTAAHAPARAGRSVVQSVASAITAATGTATTAVNSPTGSATPAVIAPTGTAAPAVNTPSAPLLGTSGTSSSTSAVLLVGGAALLLLFLVMDARKGRSPGGGPASR